MEVVRCPRIWKEAAQSQTHSGRCSRLQKRTTRGETGPYHRHHQHKLESKSSSTPEPELQTQKQKNFGVTRRYPSFPPSKIYRRERAVLAIPGSSPGLFKKSFRI